MRRHCRLFPALPALAAASLCATAALAETSPYYIGASETVSHDSNLLRAYDGQVPQPGFSKSDTIYSTALLAGFDQPFGRQRAYANAVLRNNRYASNSIYNSNGYTGNAGLDWSTVERISGSLTASANRALYSFNTGVGLLTQRNLQDTLTLNASVNVGLVTRWSLLATAGHRSVRNSLDEPSVQSLDFNQDNASIGIRWRPSSATTVGLSFSDSIGRYPKFQSLGNGQFNADRFTQPGIDLTASIQPTGNSSFDGRISQSRTRYDLNQERDFSGVTGNLGWSWTPTGKLTLGSRLSRDTGQNSTAVAIFNTPGASEYSQVYNTLRLQADYALSAKISLTTAFQVVQRTIVNTIINPLLPLSAKAKDHSNLLSLGGRWAPLRSVSLGCDLSTERRSASGDALTGPLHDRSISCFGQFQLQQ